MNENGTIDENENFYNKLDQILAAIADGKYPSPPARELYLVSKGKAKKQVTLDFIKWVVTKGQAFVPESGYVPLAKSKLEEEATKLN